MIGENFDQGAFGSAISPNDTPEAPPAVTPAPKEATPPVVASASPPLTSGLSPNYNDIVGQIESSGGTRVGNGGGKYQFMPATAKQYGGTDDAAMGRLTSANVKALSGAGIPINDVTAYVAHQQGAGGAGKLLTAAPDAIAADVVGTKNAQGNKPFFYAKDGTPLTVAQSIDVFNQRVRGAGSKAQAVTASAAPGAAPEVKTAEAEQPKTVKERLRAWVNEYVTPNNGQQQTAQAAPESDDDARERLKADEQAPVATVPLGAPTSGVVRSGGKVLFQRYGRTFDAHGNLVG